MTKTEINWQPIDTLIPETMVLLCGPSGYTNVTHRVEVGYEADNGHMRTFSNDAFTDGGPEATHWAPLPSFPEIPKTPQQALEDIRHVANDMSKLKKYLSAESPHYPEYCKYISKLDAAIKVLDAKVTK